MLAMKQSRVFFYESGESFQRSGTYIEQISAVLFVAVGFFFFLCIATAVEESEEVVEGFEGCQYE